MSLLPGDIWVDNLHIQLQTGSYIDREYGLLLLFWVVFFFKTPPFFLQEETVCLVLLAIKQFLLSDRIPCLSHIKRPRLTFVCMML